MYDDDPTDLDYVFYRKKYCPCCRARVRHRPVPVFLVKSIATTLMKGRNLARRASPSLDSDADVWAGLFADSDEEDEEEERGEDDEDDEDDEDLDGYEDEDDDDDEEVASDYVFSYGSDSDSQNYTGEYVLACWEPSSVSIDLDIAPFQDMTANQLQMLRRGVPLAMMTTYRMIYSHEDGLIAHLDDGNGPCTIYLGWNVTLSADDPDGDDFMNWIMDDIRVRPDRWVSNLDERESDGYLEARKMVREDEVQDYDGTDSELWDNEDEF
jgi:hypothetical protein